MPFLDEIIDQIIINLKQTALSDVVFQKSRFVGLTDMAYKKESEDVVRKAPFDLTDNTYVVPDDEHPMLMYFKCFNEQHKEVASGGDGNKSLQDTVNVSMLVFGFYDKIKINPRQLNAIIIDAIQNNIPLKNNDNKIILKATVKPEETNYNTKDLCDREFGVENGIFFIEPGNFFFEVKLKIESVYTKGCFTICNCENLKTKKNGR